MPIMLRKGHDAPVEDQRRIIQRVMAVEFEDLAWEQKVYFASRCKLDVYPIYRSTNFNVFYIKMDDHAKQAMEKFIEPMQNNNATLFAEQSLTTGVEV